MNRRCDIDAIKGMAILAVILYHIGLLESGYLGVDIFFVLNGFLIVPGIVKAVLSHEFNYTSFLKKRFGRLMPVLLIGCIVCLIVGYISMLPDDYENLSESVIASIFFSNNILSKITTGNYWDTVNEYKPLMHTWYLGIVMEFYIFVPFIIYLECKIKGKKNNGGGYSAVVLFSILSLIVFLSPFMKSNAKFYYLPARFFELGLGGVLGIIIENFSILNKQIKIRQFISNTVLLLLLLFIGSGFLVLDISSIGNASVVIGGEFKQERLLFSNTVLILAIVVFSLALLATKNTNLEKCRFLQAIGKRSYSLFIWHQIILAFFRYIFFEKLTLMFVICFVLLLILLSEITYRLVEHPIYGNDGIGRTLFGASLMICMVSGCIYLSAGVVRNVPELDIIKGERDRVSHSEYCDRVYSYNSNYDKNEKINVLVVGNSFARDWGNVLLESKMADKINLSFSPNFKDVSEIRVEETDYLFYFGDKQDVPEIIWNNIPKNKVYGIGTKYFGMTNGIIYAKRFGEDYFEQTVSLDIGYQELNDKWDEEWGSQYINMIELVQDENGNIMVFTPDNKFISQDCEHLTKAGACYYAQIFDWGTIFDEK